MKTLLQVAGMLQLSILIASAQVPRVLDWRRNLAGLHPFLRKLFWVYGSFIVLVIIAFVTLTFLHGGAMAAGERPTTSHWARCGRPVFGIKSFRHDPLGASCRGP